MLCPHCRKALLIVEYEGVELDACIDGHGVWFDAQELAMLFELSGVPREFHDLEQRLDKLESRRSGRRCPRCNAHMWLVHAPGSPETLVLESCDREHGLWFEKGELEELLAALLEDGDAALDRVRDFLGDFASPQVGEQEASS